MRERKGNCNNGVPATYKAFSVSSNNYSLGVIGIILCPFYSKKTEVQKLNCMSNFLQGVEWQNQIQT